MTFQTVFKRYELKYMLTTEQKEIVLNEIEPYMQLDKYKRTTIRNIYFDTENHQLIRHSIEKPAYKEKLRTRSYSQATGESTVFVELKKKHENVVYKRRLPLRETDATAWLSGKIPCPVNTQISREIDYFIHFYPHLQPTIFLSYERQAYFDKSGSDFRITFDENILCRQNDIDLCSTAYGQPILNENKVLMELKCSGGIPLWMAHLLSRERIYKTSFSKYGVAYSTLISPNTIKKSFPPHKENTVYGSNF